MSTTPDTAQNVFTLPSTLISLVDIAHLMRDIEQYDDAVTARETRMRSGVAVAQSQIKTTEAMRDFLEVNQLRLEDSRQRRELQVALERMKKTIPVVHMTFATEAHREHLEQMVMWVRTHLHPQAVIDVGLQPSLIAGVYIRTSNQVYDFSLRGALQDGRTLLKQEIGALRGV